MAGGIDWFRWHHGSVNDQKFPLVARRAGASVAEVIAVWACLLESASMNEERRGALRELPDFEAMDCALGIPEGRAEAIFGAMQQRDLVDDDMGLTAWARRQPKREDDTAADRKRAQREREAEQRAAVDRDAGGQPVTGCDVTQRHAASRKVTTEKRREEERREESSSLRSELAPTEPPAPRASRLPSNWTLPEPWEEWARVERPELDIVKTADQFRDYWCAKPGKDGRKTDWLATWRNWVRNQRAYTPPPAPQTPQAFATKNAEAKRLLGIGKPPLQEVIDA